MVHSLCQVHNSTTHVKLTLPIARHRKNKEKTYRQEWGPASNNYKGILL